VVDVVKLIDEADELVGLARKDLDSYDVHAKKARVKLRKVFDTKLPS